MKAGKTWGYVSLTSLGLGIIAAASQGDCNFIWGGGGDCTGLWIGAISIAFVFPLTGTIGIITHGSGKKNMRRSIDVYNQAYGFQWQKEKPAELRLVLRNGLGVQLTF